MFWAYHRFRNLWPIWYYVLNYKSRAKWRRYLGTHSLDIVQERILTSLQKDGIATIHISELFPKCSIWEELKSYSYSILGSSTSQEKVAAAESGKVATKGDLIVHLLGGYGGMAPLFISSDPFLRFILNNRILETVGFYLGSCPKFTMFSLHSTILLPAGSPARFSQRWHRDPDDKKITKVFLYLTDVAEESSGPFTYIKGSQYGGKWRNLYPQLPPVGRYPPEGAVGKVVPKEDIKICMGRAGTMIFCDTSGLHKGGYSTEKRRLMFAGTFVTSASVQKRNYTIENSDELNSFSPLARYAVS